MFGWRGIVFVSLLCCVSSCSSAPRSQAEWINPDALTLYLSGQQSVSIPVSQVLKAEEVNEICVLGAYAFQLPQQFRGVQGELEQTGLMPVVEGDGLVVTISQGRLDEVSVFSVWSGDVILEPAGSVDCYAVQTALLNIQKDETGSIQFAISNNQQQ